MHQDFTIASDFWRLYAVYDECNHKFWWIVFCHFDCEQIEFDCKQLGREIFVVAIVDFRCESLKLACNRFSVFFWMQA